MYQPTESAVLVVVPPAEPAVARHRRRFDLAAGWGVPAHVTVLYPFVPPPAIDERVLERLGRAVAAVPRFRAELPRTGWFGTDVLWLAPVPASSFRSLMTSVWQAFPECPPYGGQLDDVMPHLTVGHDAPVNELQAAELDVLAHLPIRLEVTTVQVMVGAKAPNSWRTIAELPLG
ncbi:MAG TPA: 2'-5' RNA ligase family protein [Jiangellaceae bacterium]|nr:2'-5' RNA ligase family protein [Jiangellaceae bacterium]